MSLHFMGLLHVMVAFFSRISHWCLKQKWFWFGKNWENRSPKAPWVAQSEEDEQRAQGKWLIFFSMSLCCLLRLTKSQRPLEGVLHNTQTAQTFTKDRIPRLKTKYKKKIFFLPINSPRTQKSISNVSSKTLKTIILDRSQALDCFNVLVSTNKGGFQNHRLGCLWKVSRIKVLGWPQNCWARVAKAVEEARKENLMMFDVKTKILPQSRHISKLKLINRNNPTGKFNDPL